MERMFESNNKWLALGLMLLLAGCNTPYKPMIAPPPAPAYAVSKWEMLPEWQTLDLVPSKQAFLQSCRVLKTKPQWQGVCARAEGLPADDSATLRAFYEEWFTPYQVFNPDGSEQGMITGYYEPLLKGSRVK